MVQDDFALEVQMNSCCEAPSGLKEAVLLLLLLLLVRL